MKLTLLAAVALLSFATPAFAAVTIDGTATPTVHGSDPGLVLTSTPGSFSTDVSLDGSAPVSTHVNNLFSVGTGEGSVEVFEDTVLYPISVAFSFTNPFDTTGGSITGESFGFYQLFTSCGLFAGGCGAVVWDGPAIFNFGDGGSFSVALDNVTFGTPGNAQVGGTFTLLSNSVPEPATWAMMLMGFGAVGFSMRRKRASQRPLAQLA